MLACDGDVLTERCDEGHPCQPGEVCGADGKCVKAPDPGTDAGVVDRPDVGPGGPPYATKAQQTSAGGHHGATQRYILTGRVDVPVSGVGKTNRYHLRSGVVSRP